MQSLGKAYPTEKGDRIILKDLDLNLEDGRCYAIMGPSGVGKTSLLRLIAGLEAPDQGNLVREGKCSMTFHENRLIDGQTAAVNVKLVVPVGMSKWMVVGAERDLDEWICEMLGQLLPEYAAVRNQPVGRYSEGMKRRVGLARALVAAEVLLQKEDKAVLLLDEPFTGLDAQTHARTADFLRQWIADHGQHLITLLTTHDPGDVEAMQAVQICLGSEAEFGNPET